jgi:hypothetical protein
VREAVLGNPGALIVFRVSGADAELFVPEFDQLPKTELVDQLPFETYVRHGIGHKHVQMLPRIIEPLGWLQIVSKTSRRHFGRPGAAVANCNGYTLNQALESY